MVAADVRTLFLVICDLRTDQLLDVVPVAGCDPEALRSAVRSACRAALARHKVPTRVVFVGSVTGDRGKKSRA